MRKRIYVFLLLLPVAISLLLIMAHFMRLDSMPLVVTGGFFLLCLFIRHPISARAVQGALLLAGIEWIRTVFGYITVRTEMGQPWTRLAVILGAVACFTLSSVLVFYTEPVRKRYGLSKKQ